MKSYHLLRHSIRQVTGNLRAALVLSIPLVVVLVGFQAVTPVDPSAEASGGGTLLFTVLTVIASLMLAVNWHRHVLLEEPTTLRPRMGRMGVYLLRGLQITLLVAIAAGVIMLVVTAVSTLLGISMAAFTAPEGASPVMMLMGLFGLIGGVFIGVWIYAVTMRLSVMLPAAAIGQGIGIRQALAHTRGTTGTMVMLMILMTLLMLVLALPLILMQLRGLFLFAAVLEFALNWFMTLLGISVLTTLHGHYVQGRALN